MADFAGSKVSTVPVGIMMLAATVAAPTGAVLAKRFGRRPVLLVPGLASIGAAALMAGGAQLRSVWLLCLGIAIQGVSFAQAQALRFIAVEFSTPSFRPHALSLVVLGALLATVLGPELAKHARTALPMEYVGSYLVLLGINVLYSGVIACVQFRLLPVIAGQQERDEAAARQHQQQQQQEAGGTYTDNDVAVAGKQQQQQEACSACPDAATTPTAEPATQRDPEAGRWSPAATAAEPRLPPRRLLDVVRQLDYVVGAATCALSYAGMGGIMAASPLPIKGHGFSFDDITSVIQVHILGMCVWGRGGRQERDGTGQWS